MIVIVEKIIMYIYMLRFIRHSITEANMKISEEKDTKLTNEGIELCNTLNGRYNLVICSTMWRTRETLLNSNIKYNNLIYSDLIREFKQGKPDNYLIREEMIPETKSDFIRRLKKFYFQIHQLAKIYPKICIITHGVVLRYLIGHWFQNAESVIIPLDEWTFKYDYLIENK